MTPTKNANCLANINGADTVTAAVFILLMVPVRLATVCAGLNYLRIAMMDAHIPLWLTFLLLPALAIQPFFAILIGNRLREASARFAKGILQRERRILNSLRAPLDIHLMNAHAQRSAEFSMS